ncbi:fatty acid desaturase [Aestuariivivens sp. NBU2969]|uniref:fatty acid desaturase family protein n=1 Tax=Aestuariivivens sp. NBU2969 TaxID=2873267 RepID=UPI001CBCEDB9|nr:fatty acid desaturase [Aestuariivivens sp. NBU2969]
MNQNKTISKNLKARNDIAFFSLLIPVTLLVSGVLLSIKYEGLLYWVGQLVLSFFFLQTFILLHECAHLSFFKSRSINVVFGHLFGILSFIPYYSWQQMHNLHHRWTGWRDKDPTTESTISPSSSKVKNCIVNIAWKLCIPLFYLSYKLSNYWNLFKIKRFLNPKKYKKVKTQFLVYLAVYAMLFYFFWKYIVQVFIFAFAISLLWKELVIMTQHSHIEIPISNNKEVKPISYLDQVQYTRSFYVNLFFAKYFLFNFNLHEVHHAHPGIPSYKLSDIKLEAHQKPNFFYWLFKAKKMKGVDYIFKSSKHTGEMF